MDSEGDSIKSHTESEEDDYGCYFLQPSSSPYNLIEKVQQANVDLFSSLPLPDNGKSVKVKFKDELISFEPELTDDDVNSIESDHAEITTEYHPSVLEYKTAIVNQNVDIFNIEEAEEDEVEEEEIIEEIVSDVDVAVKDVEHKNKTESIVNVLKPSQEAIRVESSKRSSKSSKRSKGSKSKLLYPDEVQCKEHCIDKLDCDLSMSIKKLEIHEKVHLPPLQLLQRKCCDEVKQKIPKNLPMYNGSRSEYGLTSRQLAKREKQKELLKLREEMRRKLITEYRNRKIQQNEEVFCQWLKEVAKRKAEKENSKKQKPKSSVTPKVITLPNKTAGKVRERPTTANELLPKTSIKKRRRPHTTHSCVYIEVPQSMLERGIQLGDLVITNSKLFTRNLHILAVS